MLGTVLDRITKLFGRAFFIGAFFPVVLFVALNIAITGFYAGWEGIGSWWEGAFASKSILALLLLVGVTAFAYLVMILNPMLKRVLEGRYRLGLLGARMLEQKRAAFARADRAVQQDLAAFEVRRRLHQEIRQELIAAYENRSKGQVGGAVSDPTEPGLESVRARLSALSAAEFDAEAARVCAAALVALYRSAAPSAEVEKLHRDLDRVLADATQVAEQRYSESLTDLSSRFDRSGGLAGVRVTALGNVMNAIWGYPFSRYGIDPVATWSSLQTVIPKEYFPTVEDSRISYDFAVICTYLSLTVALLWLVVGVRHSMSAWPLLILAPPVAPVLAVIGGVLALFAFRALAIEAARAFGAVFRTCFDLYRFDLLKKLSLPLPANLREERELWERVNQLLVYGDYTQKLEYAHDGKPAPRPATSAKAAKPAIVASPAPESTLSERLGAAWQTFWGSGESGKAAAASPTGKAGSQ